jgi:DNA-binding transcriptional LysR family regulator
MEIAQLYAFQLVTKYKSFSKAAAELHLTQPAVTLQIKRLESEVNEILVDRSGRTLGLTPAGMVFLTYVNQILYLSEQAVESVGQFSNSRGRITIAAGTTNTIFRLPLILQNYRRRYPQVEIRILNGDSKLTTQLVYDNAVDLGLVTTINPKEDNLMKILPVFKDPIWLIAPQGYPRQIAIPELEKESLILFRAGTGFRNFLDEQFRLNGFVPKATMEMESIEAIIRLVRSGLGLAFLPEVAAREELAIGELQKMDLINWAPMIRQTYLIYRRDKFLTWPVKAFLEQMAD